MNSLGQDVRPGTKVIMQGDGPENYRTVTVLNGFGMSNTTAGTSIFVKTQMGFETKMDSMEIERLVE